MKKISVFALTLLLLVVTVSLYAVTLAWCPPDCTNPPVAGYKVGYGTGLTTNWSPQVVQYLNTNNPCEGYVVISPGSNWLNRYTSYADSGTNTTITLTNLTPGETYYFVAFWYTADGQSSPPSNEIAYTIPTNPPPKITYLGTRLEWWTNMANINRQNFSLMSFTNPPANQFYRSFLVITNRWNSPVKIVDLKTRLEWWTNMAYINRQTFDLKSFTNPPNLQFYRSFLVITNNPF
jgi:hypothetical protein